MVRKEGVHVRFADDLFMIDSEENSPSHLISSTATSDSRPLVHASPLSYSGSATSKKNSRLPNVMPGRRYCSRRPTKFGVMMTSSSWLCSMALLLFLSVFILPLVLVLVFCPSCF